MRLMFPLRFFLLITVLLAVTALRANVATNKAAAESSEYARLLDAYVVEEGVQYSKWMQNEADVQALDTVLADWARVDVAALQPSEQKAFYINLYNAGMLQAVLNNYPLKSVKDIGFLPFSIFKKKYILLGGTELSLDHIEKGILLQEYFDPRIHFAVNCASESCPPLRAEPYVAARLEEQLKEQTVLFAESSRAARVHAADRSVAYSELFKWYADDFGVKNPATFLNNYRTTTISTMYSVDWIDYDWSLNAASK